ncbi:ATP-binding protein [Pedobacter steynii]|uniref:histidine kinase n=1 Tax=Pedobacter steynii TaxID=430522 RepID=A0A1D7QJT7_9SPHI|nr:ATP-binding protein [Pedobacter steynii]AOM78945.1 hypothetical protein BFS30_18280 [Pedobacter steynii]
MRSFADFSNNYLTQPDLVFFNRILQFQNAYYSNGQKERVLEQLLHELCELTQSDSAGLINNKNRLKDVFVNNGQVGLVHATFKNTGTGTGNYQIKKIGEQSMLICSIKDAEGIVGLIYLIRSNQPFTVENYAMIKPAIPILNGMLAYMNLYGKSVPELDIQLKKTASLQLLIESLDDIILELDENTVIKKVWVKDKSKLFMPPELFIGKTLTEVMGGFAYVFMECIHELLITGERQECVYPDFDVNKDFWYSAKFQKIDGENDADAVRVICVIEDITAKKLMSDQLQQSTTELKRINNLLDIGLDISKMGGWEYQLQNRELFVTKQINDIKDLDHQVVLDYKTILDYFDHDNKIILLNTLNEAFKGFQPFDIELELTSATYQKKWVRIAGVPVSENGYVQSFRGILKDITHNKKNQEELIAAKNLAEQIARKRTEILSIMSHEIRTPLNGIIGICNLLNQNDFPDPQIREYLDHLSFSSNHLLSLVNDILDLEKIENKKMELNETEGDLVGLVGNIIKQFQSLAEVKGLELKFYADHGIPSSVIFDELRLGRILNNLIGNAIKFTEKGEVRISLKAVRQEGRMIRVLFKIEDTGIGIPEHLHNLVFDKFHQVQQASHRQQQGTGLGLSITKGLVSLFKSEIFLRSRVNEGTTFEFEIEFEVVKGPDLRRVIKGERRIKDILPGLRLLVVDDNPVNLLVAKRQLWNFGIDAEQADNGYTALAMLKAEEFDIILIDLHMPGMDGYQLARQVQVDYPETKVIIFTADILEEVRMRLAEMGITYVLSKPFNPDEMHELLLEVINNTG